MKLTVLGESSQFWQWDTGQKLIVEDNGTCNEVHFSNAPNVNALVCPIMEQNGLRIVEVPNILLRESSPINVFLYNYDSDGSETLYSRRFAVRPRPKPESYVYTETEVLDYANLDQRIVNLEGKGLFVDSNGYITM